MVACNTASAFSLDSLRAHYGENFPIIGLVPALKPAVLQSQTKTVAVLATPATFRGQLIQDVMERFAKPAQVKVIPITSLELVPFVEAGADFLVLGCTHYPFLKTAIWHIFGHKLTLIDSGVAVARQTARILIKNELLFEQVRKDMVRIECYVSGQNATCLTPILTRLISADLTWTIRNLGI